MSGRKPDLIANSVTEGADGKSYFTRIGVAWKNKVEGFNIKLEALPVGGEIVLMPPREQSEKTTPAEEAEIA